MAQGNGADIFAQAVFAPSANAPPHILRHEFRTTHQVAKIARRLGTLRGSPAPSQAAVHLSVDAAPRQRVHLLGIYTGCRGA